MLRSQTHNRVCHVQCSDIYLTGAPASKQLQLIVARPHGVSHGTAERAYPPWFTLRQGAVPTRLTLFCRTSVNRAAAIDGSRGSEAS